MDGHDADNSKQSTADATAFTIMTSDAIKDSISELPSCVLGFIVSFLSMKDAVKTSILSRRWRYLCTGRLHLHLDPSDILSSSTNHSQKSRFGSVEGFEIEKFNHSRKRRFESVEGFEIEKFEFLTRADHVVKLFHGKRIISFKVDFFLDKGCSFYLDRWISNAINSGVEKIELSSLLDKDFKRMLIEKLGKSYLYKFPYRLFSSRPNSMLKHLHLQDCVMKAPRDFHGFRSLTTLYLQSVLLAKDFVTNLFFNCMQLENLTLCACRSSSTLRVIGRSLRLVHLKVLYTHFPMIEISAENLTTLEYWGNTKKICAFQAPRLEKIFLYANYFVDVLYALEKFARFTTQLEILLRSQSAAELLRENIERLPESIGVFRNLRQLSFSLYTICGRSQHPSWILSFLKAAPLLQKLRLTFFYNLSGKDVLDIETECEVVHDELKEFEMHGLFGSWYDIEFAKIVLRATTKLERIVIEPSAKIYAGNGRFTYMHGSDLPPRERSLKDSVFGVELQNYVPTGVQLVFSS